MAHVLCPPSHPTACPLTSPCPPTIATPHLLQVTGTGGLQWVGEALAPVPDEAATAADKQRFMAACQEVVAGGLAVNDERGVQQAVDELSELCRRNRRSAQLAQRALLPPELHYTIR